MTGPRVLIGVVVVAGLIGAGSLRAQKAGATGTLSAQDVSDITQLYSSSYQGADLRDADLWLSAYADDAVFTLPTGRRWSAGRRWPSGGRKLRRQSRRLEVAALVRAHSRLPAPDGVLPPRRITR